MSDDATNELRIFHLKAQLRCALEEKEKAERKTLREEARRTTYIALSRPIFGAAYRVVTCARQWVDANAFGEGDADLAWLTLYQSICDFDEETKILLEEQEGGGE